MKCKGLLSVILLSLSFCLVPWAVYGEIPGFLFEEKPTGMDLYLVRATVNYIMRYPDHFLDIHLFYDGDGWYGQEFLPQGVSTKGKIFILATDNREEIFSSSEEVLLERFQLALEAIYTHIEPITTSIDNDVAAVLYSTKTIPLAYFSEGEYHLLEE